MSTLPIYATATTTENKINYSELLSQQNKISRNGNKCIRFCSLSYLERAKFSWGTINIYIHSCIASYKFNTKLPYILYRVI